MKDEDFEKAVTGISIKAQSIDGYDFDRHLALTLLVLIDAVVLLARVVQTKPIGGGE